jgi:Ca2+-binding EF-hand superfamily protein
MAAVQTQTPEMKGVQWIEETQTKIREAFELFDKDKTDSIIQEEVGTVMRALGAYPDERQLVLTYLPDMQDEESTGFVSYARFEKVMLNILASRECEPDSSELLLQAFRTIDAEGQGWISAEILEAMLTSKGTPFRPKELENFLQAAKNPETGNIFYEDYVALCSAAL